MQKPVPFAALVGIDWADRKHDVCLCAAGSTKRERSVVPHTPAALRDWANKLEITPLWWTPRKGLLSSEIHQCRNANHAPTHSRRTPSAD